MTLPDYPFDSHFFTHPNQVRQHYLDQGPTDGEWVVMLHGNPSWSYYYRHLVKDLQTKHRCIVPDHIGMGLSDKPSDEANASPRYDYTLQSRVDDFARLMQFLFERDAQKESAATDSAKSTQLASKPNRKLTLIVHDWGGMIGMAWAVKNPERIARIVVLNTGAFLNPKNLKLPWTLRLGRDSFLGTLLIRGLNAFAWGAATFGVKRRLPAAQKRALTSPYNSWQNRIATLRFVQDIPLTEADRGFNIVRETSAQLQLLYDKPMRIFWGRQDFVFDNAFLDEWQRRFARAQTTVFEDAGHYVLEDAHERIVPLLREFLGQYPELIDA